MPKGKGQGGQEQEPNKAKAQFKAPPAGFTPAPSPEAAKEFASKKPLVKPPPMGKGQASSSTGGQQWLGSMYCLTNFAQHGKNNMDISLRHLKVKEKAKGKESKGESSEESFDYQQHLASFLGCIELENQTRCRYQLHVLRPSSPLPVKEEQSPTSPADRTGFCSNFRWNKRTHHPVLSGQRNHFQLLNSSKLRRLAQSCFVVMCSSCIKMLSCISCKGTKGHVLHQEG